MPIHNNYGATYNEPSVSTPPRSYAPRTPWMPMGDPLYQISPTYNEPNYQHSATYNEPPVPCARLPFPLLGALGGVLVVIIVVVGIGIKGLLQQPLPASNPTTRVNLGTLTTVTHEGHRYVIYENSTGVALLLHPTEKTAP